MDPPAIATAFFDRYARALLDRDADELARLYAVPSLILFPGQSVAVTDEGQTAAFFASSFDQYEGVTEALPAVTVVASATHSTWAEVTWSYDGAPRERFVYQLVDGGQGGWKVGVLTPVE